MQLEIVPTDLGRLKPDVETAVFRIIQEALTNMFRHSGAHNGRVALSEKEGHILVTIRDDGKGLDESVIQLRPDSVGVGIGGMRQRVAELGGRLRLANVNPGTLVEVLIPSRPQERLAPVAALNNFAD
jgi:signal transduction histidine kinase